MNLKTRTGKSGDVTVWLWERPNCEVHPSQFAYYKIKLEGEWRYICSECLLALQVRVEEDKVYKLGIIEETEEFTDVCERPDHEVANCEASSPQT